MYSTSEYYRAAINKPSPSYLTGTITFKDGSSREFQNSEIALGGASITMQAVTEDVLEFGASVLGQLDISITTDKSESRYKYYDASIDLQFHIDTEIGLETMPLGQWTITEAEREKTALKLTAYDNLFKLDKRLETSFVDLPYVIMKQIAEDCGCELSEDEDFYRSLPNGNDTLTITENSSCSTYRQAAAVVAQMCGCFVQADRNGKISLRQFATTPTFTLSMAERYSSSISDFVCKYVQLEIVSLSGTFVSITEEDATGMTMYIEDAPAWDDGTEEVLQRKADSLMAYLETIQYTPSELVAFSDPSIDCGDLITLETENGIVNTLVTSYTWKFHGQMEIQSVGKNPYLISTSAETQRKIRDLEVNGSTGGGVTSALYTFKNAQRFKCTDRLEVLGQVTFAATKDTFVMFNGTMQVDVEVPDEKHTTTFTMLDSEGNSKTYEIPYNRAGKATITIQYYYNAVEYGRPYVATLETGSHIISLNYPISSVAEDSIGRFEVRISADSGSVIVAKERFLGTISGQGLAGKIRWDGTITVREVVGVVGREPFTVAKVSDSVNFAKITREYGASELSEKFRTVRLQPFSVIGIDASVGIAKIITNYTFETAKRALYNFNRDIVYSGESFYLKTDYEYESTTHAIDSGTLCSAVIKTSNKQSVESVEIISGRKKVSE